MVEHEDSAPNGLVVRRNLSLIERLMSSRVMMMFFAVFFLMGIVGGAVIACLAGTSLAYSPLLWLVAAFAFGSGFGLIGWGAMQAGSMLLSSKRRKLIALQKKMTEQPSADFCADLQKLVQGYLEFKDYQVADFYSAMLLKQSALPPEQRANKLGEQVATVGCWASTPQYHRRANYKFVWLYESRGKLVMTPKRLQYTSKRICFDVDLADVREVATEHHPRWLTIIPLQYIIVNFIDNGIEQQIYITPSLSETGTFSDANKNVVEWAELIIAAREKRIAGRAIEKMKAQVPGVESSSEQKV